MPPCPSRIRRLFLDPLPTYSLTQAAALLGIKRREMRGWVEAGEIELESGGGGEAAVPWRELVSFALGFWNQAEVEAALGVEVADALPELLRLADLEVRIPRLEVVALQKVAARDGKSVDAVLARELLDLVSAESEWLAGAVPGFAAALAWPEQPAPTRLPC
jgi:hypothetical protein